MDEQLKVIIEKMQEENKVRVDAGQEPLHSAAAFEEVVNEYNKNNKSLGYESKKETTFAPDGEVELDPVNKAKNSGINLNPDSNQQQPFFKINDIVYDIDELNEISNGDPENYLRENNGKFFYKEGRSVPEVKVTPLYQETKRKADELFDTELDLIFDKVYERKSGLYNIGNTGNPDDEYLIKYHNDPLTGLETVSDGYTPIGVKRKRTNNKGNSAVTGSELKHIGTKMWEQLKSEDEYLGGYGEQSFNYITQKKTEKELLEWAEVHALKMDWDNPDAMENYMKDYNNKMESLWIREAKNDEKYQYNAKVIQDILFDKFRPLIVNKTIEEEKSSLIPDVWENAGSFFEGTYKLFNITIPGALADGAVVSNGEVIYKITNNIKEAERSKWTDDTKGYIGMADGRLVFKKGRNAYVAASMRNTKATTWKEAKVLLEEEVNKRGMVIMEQLATSKEYQEKLALLGSPELFDEDWNWTLDGEGYKELLGTQLGQMVLGTLSFGGSTFIQELGQMSNQLIIEKSVMLMEGIPMDGSIANFNEKEIEHLMAKFNKLSVKEQNDLAMEVLRNGHIPFDELYASSARSSGLDLVGNFFVFAKGTKLIPKQLINGFVTKNLNQFLKGGGKLLATVGAGTLAEVLTESLQATNSEATVSLNSPLSTFDFHPVLNEGAMAALVPGPVIIATGTISSIVDAAKSNNLDASEGSYKAWFDAAKKKIDNSNLSNKEKTKAYDNLFESEQVLYNTNLKDVKDPKARERIIKSVIESNKDQARINELQAEIDKESKGQKSSKKSKDTISKNEKEIAVLQLKVDKAQQSMIQDKAISHFLINAEKQAHWQNQQTEGLNKNRFTKIFKTAKEAKEYILKNHPGEYKQFENMLNGDYGTNVQIIGSDGEVIAYNFAIQEHVIAGIRSGDLMAGNVINHEQAHDNLSTFSTAELKSIREKTLDEMNQSSDPQIQRALALMNLKLDQYKKQKGTRNEHEEFFTAMSDAFHYLKMENLSIEGNTTLSFIGEIFSASFNDNIGPIINWKEGFDSVGVVEFIKRYTESSGKYSEGSKDIIEDLRGEPEPGIFDEGVEKGKDGIFVQDSRRVYPEGRTSKEIKQANSVLSDEILKEKSNPSYKNENDPILQKRINDDAIKKLEAELIANNMGLINMFLKDKSNGGLYFDYQAGNISFDDFSEAVMAEVGIIMNSYDASKGDFGMYLGGLMDKRIPGIFDSLVKKAEGQYTPEYDPNTIDDSYEDFMNDFDNEIINIGGEESNIIIETSKMRKVLNIKEGDLLYNQVLDDVLDITIQNFEALNTEGFLLDTQDQLKLRLFKKIKSQLGSPKSEKYIKFLNDNIEQIYNLLPQSVFNKSYDQFNEIGGRANVKQSEDKDVEFNKGVKIKSKTAGNRIATKKPFTEEIGIQFINALLDPKAQGLKGTPASKQDGLVDQLSVVIGLDAVSTAINSKEFKEAHGTQDAIMGVIADKINRDMTVQFSARVNGKKIKYQLNSTKDLQNASKLISMVETSGFVNPEDVEEYVLKMSKSLGIKQDVANFVLHLDSKDIIEKGDAVRFKADIIKYLNKTNPDLAARLKKDGAIRGKGKVLDKIAEEIVEFTGGLDPEMLEAVGYDIFAFHSRVLNAAETQQGPKRGDGKVVQIQNAKNPNGNRSYANKNTTLLLDGWTFNPTTNKFYHNKGKYPASVDPVKDHGASTVSAPYFETLQGIKNTNNLKLNEIAETNKDNPNYVSKYNNVRIMNADYPGGLFKNIGKILNDKSLNRQQKIDKIQSKYGSEIEAANKANTELATDISVSLIKAVVDGSMDEATLIHVLQSQTNLAFGFRGLTKLSMISVLEGSYKDNGDRLYGEHINPNSSKMLELAKIALKAKNDPEYNYRAAVAELFADHEQIIFPSSNAKKIDTSKLLKGPTDMSGYDRLKALTPQEQANFVGINGENYKQALANANARKNIEIETATKKFESERKLLKDNAKINILVGEENGSTVYDFDETLAYSDNIVYATNKLTGEKIELTSNQWKNWRGGQDYDYDFTDFNYVTNGKPGPMIPDLIKTIDKHGVDGVFILTARHNDSAIAMHNFVNGELIKHYKSKGVALKDIPQIPLENFTGVGNSTGEAKANWIQENLILNGFNRIKFADDAAFNTKAVQDMFDLYPPELLEGRTVLVKESLSVDFNKILEVSEGIKAEKVFSKAQGVIRGKSSGSYLDLLYPPSAYDFEMFTYMYRGKGEKGDQDALFFKEALFDPYNVAIAQIDKQKQEIRDNYTALVKELPQINKNLKNNVEGTNYTLEQAVRVYTWSKNGIEVPGLSKRDQATLIKVVEADPDLIMFSDRLSAISQQEGGYVAPSEYWTIEGIAYDLTEMTGNAGRAKYLASWKENVELIFSEENKSKLRSLYGNKHVEALEDMLYRMEYGRKKNTPGRIESQWNNWVNNSVGAVMFFNMRSATLQTISAFNYMDWKDNNPAKAAMAFANQPQYWKDFSMIFNSDYLKERRSGNKRTINEAELSAHLKGADNKAKAALSWLLEKGFSPTQIADSFAIASGGASFYRNKVKALEQTGMSTTEAEAQAFIEFRDKTEKGQQSSRPDLISQQQAGGLGRLILAFKNTPMQYNRLIAKAVMDLKNKRGSTKENLSKIAYYGAVQNVIFSSLQTALFSALGDEDQWDTKKERVANGMVDSILNGMGLTGAAVVTIKNGFLQYRKQKARGFNADHTRTIIDFANLSPTIGSKLRKMYSGIRTEQLNVNAIEEMGFSMENPAFNSLASVISATTNIPLDRAVNKIQNVLLASKDEVEASKKIALLLGWNPWDLGLEDMSEARKVNKEVKERKKEEKKVEKEKEKEKEREEKQKEQKKKGEQLTCLKCNRKVVPGKKVCTVHEKKEQTEGGKEKQCSKIKKDKTRCKMMTANKSGKCYYHD